MKSGRDRNPSHSSHSSTRRARTDLAMPDQTATAEPYPDKRCSAEPGQAGTGHDCHTATCRDEPGRDAPSLDMPGRAVTAMTNPAAPGPDTPDLDGPGLAETAMP